MLRVQWLRSLGPILTDYEQMTMKFMKDCQMIGLSATTKPNPEIVSLHQLKRLASTNVIDTLVQVNNPPLEPIQAIIHRFCDQFATPPFRAIDNHIPLLEGANRVNV